MMGVLSAKNERQIAKLIVRSAKAYFEKEDNRRAFEKWYQQNYHKKYKWKKENP